MTPADIDDAFAGLLAVLALFVAACVGSGLQRLADKVARRRARLPLPVKRGAR